MEDLEVLDHQPNLVTRTTSDSDPLDVLNDFAAVNIQIKSSESLKGAPSRNSETNDDGLLSSAPISQSQSQAGIVLDHHNQHHDHDNDDDLFNILDHNHDDHHKDMETVNNTMLNKQLGASGGSKSPTSSLVQRTGSESPRRRPTDSDDNNSHMPPSHLGATSPEQSKPASIIASPTSSAAALSVVDDKEKENKSPKQKAVVKDKDGSTSARDITDKVSPDKKVAKIDKDKEKEKSTEDTSPSRAANKKAIKQMADEAEAIAMQAKQTKIQQQQAQKELKENRLGLNNKEKREKEKEKDKNAGDKSDRPEATDRSERESRQSTKDKEKEKEKDKKLPRSSAAAGEKVKQSSQQQDETPSTEQSPSEDNNNNAMNNEDKGKDKDKDNKNGTKLPVIKTSQQSGSSSVQKLLSKVNAASASPANNCLKPKGMIEAEKRVNEKIAAAEKVRLPKIRKVVTNNNNNKVSPSPSQANKLISQDDNSQEEDHDHDHDHDLDDNGSVVMNRKSIVGGPPHSSPSGSVTSLKRKSKKPLFMRLIAKAQRKMMKEEQAKQEEYNKLKQNRPHRVPTRNELKEHMHKFDEMMKHHQEQQQKNHIENIRALRQARKKMEEKLNNIESVIDDHSEWDSDAIGGGEDGNGEIGNTPSPKKKVKRSTTKNKDKTPTGNRSHSVDGDDLENASLGNNNNEHDGEDGEDNHSIMSSPPHPRGKHHKNSSSPGKKPYTTPSNKMEVVSTSVPLSPRSPRIPAGENKSSIKGASPRSIKTKKSSSTDQEEEGEQQEQTQDTQPKTLFDDDTDDLPPKKDSQSVVNIVLGEPLSPRTEVTSDWFGRLLSTESLSMFD